MGFRSNFITEYTGDEIPQWFLDKYPNYVYSEYQGKKEFSIAQLFESKFYDSFEEDERFTDIQKVLKEIGLDDIVVILLHECGGITRVKITHDTITAREPIEWKEVGNVEHNYCYRCSDNINKLIK